MSAALKALAYRPYDKVPDETRQGWIYYSGNASDYYFWEFKTDLKIKTTKKEDFPSAVARLIESLRGDALQIAMIIRCRETNQG